MDEDGAVFMVSENEGWRLERLGHVMNNIRYEIKPYGLISLKDKQGVLEANFDSTLVTTNKMDVLGILARAWNNQGEYSVEVKHRGVSVISSVDITK